MLGKLKMSLLLSKPQEQREELLSFGEIMSDVFLQRRYDNRHQLIVETSAKVLGEADEQS